MDTTDNNNYKVFNMETFCIGFSNTLRNVWYSQIITMRRFSWIYFQAMKYMQNNLNDCVMRRLVSHHAAIFDGNYFRHYM